MQRAIVLLVAILMGSPFVGAQADEESLRGELDTGSSSINVGVDGTRAVVEYGRDNDSSADSLYVALDPRVGTLWVRSRDAGGGTPRATTIRFEQLVEFTDRDGDGIYTANVDRALRTYTPRDMAWQTLPVRNTGEGHSLIGVGLFRDGGGKLAWAVDARGNYTAPGATRLALSGLEVAFELAGYEPSEPGARLALVLTHRQQGEVAGLAQGAMFPWPTTVRVNGVDEIVLLPNASDARAGKSTLSFGPTAGGHLSIDEDSPAVRMVACAMRFVC